MIAVGGGTKRKSSTVPAAGPVKKLRYRERLAALGLDSAFEKTVDGLGGSQGVEGF